MNRVGQSKKCGFGSRKTPSAVSTMTSSSGRATACGNPNRRPHSRRIAPAVITSTRMARHVRSDMSGGFSPNSRDVFDSGADGESEKSATLFTRIRCAAISSRDEHIRDRAVERPAHSVLAVAERTPSWRLGELYSQPTVGWGSLKSGISSRQQRTRGRADSECQEEREEDRVARSEV